MSSKRKAGDPLHLILNIGESTTDLFARAFITDQTGASLGTIDLDNDGECFSNHTTVMPNTAYILAKYKVYQDAAFSIEDCEFPWATDQFDLDSLLPSQFAGADAILAKISNGEIAVEMCGKLNASLSPALLYAKIENNTLLNVSLDNGNLAAVIDTEKLTADLD